MNISNWIDAKIPPKTTGRRLVYTKTGIYIAEWNGFYWRDMNETGDRLDIIAWQPLPHDAVMKDKYYTITVTADLHGEFPKTPGGDILIIAGDCTSNDSPQAWCNFFDWFREQKYDQKIYIGGNHDNFLQNCLSTPDAFKMLGEIHDFIYLNDDNCIIDGIKIHGSPWTSRFPHMNPHCQAFTRSTDEKLKEYFDKIPDDTDILITHSPPYTILDKNKEGKYCGSRTLCEKIQHVKPDIHIFGHIHEGYGTEWAYTETPDARFLDASYPGGTLYINASHMDENYDAVNPPITFQYNPLTKKIIIHEVDQ